MSSVSPKVEFSRPIQIRPHMFFALKANNEAERDAMYPALSQLETLLQLLGNNKSEPITKYLSKVTAGCPSTTHMEKAHWQHSTRFHFKADRGAIRSDAPELSSLAHYS